MWKPRSNPSRTSSDIASASSLRRPFRAARPCNFGGDRVAAVRGKALDRAAYVVDRLLCSLRDRRQVGVWKRGKAGGQLPGVRERLQVLPPERLAGPEGRTDEEGRLDAGRPEDGSDDVKVAREVVVEGERDRNRLATPPGSCRVQQARGRDDPEALLEQRETLLEPASREGRHELALAIAGGLSDPVVGEHEPGSGREASEPSPERRPRSHP